MKKKYLNPDYEIELFIISNSILTASGGGEFEIEFPED